MGGSSKKQTVGYRYYMGLMMVLCRGPVDKVIKLIAGERDAWVGPMDRSGAIKISAPKLFGGDKREGGLDGVAEIMMGTPTQTLSSWAKGLLPQPHVGFRGVVSVLYDGLVASNSPYMKAWAWRVERTLKGWEADDPWYPAKARIPLSEATEQVVGTYSLLWPDLRSGDAGYPAPGSLHPHVVTLGPWDVDVELRVGDADGVGTLGCDDYLQINGVTVNPAGLPAAGTMPAGTVLGTFPAGTTLTMRVLNSFNPLSGGQGTVTAWRTVPGAAAANPAHIVVECLTSTEWGEGWPRSMIGASFTAAADALFNEAFGLCYLWKPGDTWAFIDEVCAAAGAVVYQDPRTGLFEMRLLRADYVAADQPLFETTPDQVESFQRATFGDLVNQVTVVYREWTSNEDDSVTVRNAACIAAQGGVVPEKVEYPGIPTAAQAARVAQRDVMLKSTPLAKATILVDRSAWSLTPGAVIRWRFTQEGVDGVPCRVLAIDRGELADGTIKLTIAEDLFGLPAASYIGSEPSAWEQPPSTASAPALQQLVEVPYRSLVAELSAADVAALDDDASYFGATAARPSGVALGMDIWSRSSSTSTYSEAGAGQFVPAAELADDIEPLVAELPLSAGQDLDEVEADDYVIVGTGRAAEWCQVISLDMATAVATVRRGVLDTIPRAWPAGTVVFFDDARSAVDGVERATAETTVWKLLTRTSSDTLDLDDGVEISATADQRQARPYPPANVRINSQYWPALAETPVTLTWAHRDRTQQTAPAAQAWTDGSIGPESGVTYSLTVRDAATNSLLYSAEGLTETSTVFSAAGSAEAIITLRAVRDGLECWQPYQHSLVLADGVLAAEDGALLSTEDGALLVADVAGFEISNPRFIIERAGQLVVAAYGTCLVSSDGGATYSSVSGFDGSSWVPTGLSAARDDGYLVRVVRSFGAGWGAVLVADLDDLEAGYTETVNDVAGGQAWRLYGYPRTTAGVPIAIFGLTSDGTHFWAVGACPQDAISLGARQMFRSTDGITWEVIGALTVDAADPNALSGTNVLGTWSRFWPVWPSLSNGTGELGYGVLRRHAGRWFMATIWAIYYTDDADGVTGWRRCPTGLGEDGTDSNAHRLIAPQWVGGYLVAVNGAVFPAARVSVSSDNGVAWATVAIAGWVSGDRFNDNQVGVVGDEVFMYAPYTDPQRIYRAPAPFTSWATTVAAGFNAGQPNLYVRSTATGIAAMTDSDQRLWHSSDGVTFVLANLED